MTQQEKNAIKANNREFFIQELLGKRQKELQNNDDKQVKVYELLIDKLKKQKIKKQFSSDKDYKIYWENIIKDFIEVIENEFDFLKSQKLKECIDLKDEEQYNDCIEQAIDFLQEQIAQYRLKKLQIKNQMLLTLQTNNTQEIQSVYSKLKHKLQFIFQTSNKILEDSIYNIKTQKQDLTQDTNNTKRTYYNPYKYVYPWQQKPKVNIPEDSLFYTMKMAGKLSRDWQSEGKVTSVKDQGECGACWIFSAVSTIESQLMLDGYSEKDLSEQQPLNCALEHYGKNINACDGSMGQIALKSIEKTGIQLEHELPYTGVDNECEEIKNYHTRFDIAQHYFLKKSGDMQEFLETLYERPLGVALYISDVFLKYDQGIIDCLSKSFYKGSANNHEVLAVGYHIDLINPSNSYIKFKNQWTTSWGEDGYFRLKLYNIEGHISKRKIVSRTFTGYQEKLYLYFGPCGILRSKKDTFWVKMKN